MVAVVSDAVWQAVITAVVAIALAWIGYMTAKLNRKMDVVRTEMNGKLKELVETKEKAAESVGQEKERVANRDRVAQQAIGANKVVPPTPPPV